MSSERILVWALVGALSSAACADVRRGEYWDEPTEDEDTAAEPATSAEPPADDDGAATTAATGEPTGGTPMGPAFASDVLPLLRAGCERCHSADGQANDTSFILGDDEAEAYEMTLDFVDLESPSRSRLLTKATGQGHIGGVIFDDRSPEYATILDWIEQGANP